MEQLQTLIKKEAKSLYLPYSDELAKVTECLMANACGVIEDSNLPPSRKAISKFKELLTGAVGNAARNLATGNSISLRTRDGIAVNPGSTVYIVDEDDYDEDEPIALIVTSVDVLNKTLTCVNSNSCCDSDDLDSIRQDIQDDPDMLITVNTDETDVYSDSTHFMKTCECYDVNLNELQPGNYVRILDELENPDDEQYLYEVEYTAGQYAYITYAEHCGNTMEVYANSLILDEDVPAFKRKLKAEAKKKVQRK